MCPQAKGDTGTEGGSNIASEPQRLNPLGSSEHAPSRPQIESLGIPASRTSNDQSANLGGSASLTPGSEPAPPSSPTRKGRDRAGDAKRANGRSRSRASGSRGPRDAHGSRICRKCNEPLTGQFVRALGSTFHLECFKCRDCGQIVASKFFPVDEEDGSGQYPLCETDYFRRLDLLCFECGGALRGSYITALDRKYHIDHFTCSVCPTVFGAQDSYYEHEGKVYCHYHYSTRFAQRCNGCQTAILKQFVEIFRNGQNQHWHPECYMIHKFWNVRLSPVGENVQLLTHSVDATSEEREKVRLEEEHMEEKVYRIWSVLSAFEESSATCISNMLLNVSNGAYFDGVLVAKQFIWHVDILFASIDRLEKLMTSHGMKGLSYSREAKLLCKKIVAFFSLLTNTQHTGVKKLGVTQELLSLVTGLAHYLKLLIRISLQGALKLEREKGNQDGLWHFLEELGDLESMKEAEMSLEAAAGVQGLAGKEPDRCSGCRKPVEDACARLGEGRWHINCLMCSGCARELGKSLADARWDPHERRVLCSTCAETVPGVDNEFQAVSRLQQFVFLLRVALARVLVMLKSMHHTSDDPNLTDYDSNEGHRVSPTGQLDPPMLKSNTRSKSYGAPVEEQSNSSYAQTMSDIQRLRSTRMEKQVSSSIRKARTSKIIEAPESRNIRPGSAGADGSDAKNHGYQAVDDREANANRTAEVTFGNQDSLTLDDIPRIVAAEQAREQRPNAYKHARNQLIQASSVQQPKLVGGHQRGVSGGKELEKLAEEPSAQRTKRYFSELSALEYFIVRHVAVLSMEPLLEGYFNLEELLELIESRKPTFWGKFGKAFKTEPRRGGKKRGVFGVSLDALNEKDGAESTHGVGPGTLKVPALLDDAVTAMRGMDMSVEGVFRKNGNIRRLKDLADQIDNKGCDAVDLSKESPVQIAALLRKFLRELPEPLLTFKLHRLFVTAQRIADEEKRRRVLHLTCCLLPKSHRDAMEILFAFLSWTASFSHVDEESGSKMDVHNLATVVTPNILYADNKAIGMDDSFLAIEAVHSLIEFNESMCEVPEDLQSILNDTALFNGSADITTKEILKRYGDVGRAGRQIPIVEEVTPPRSKEGRTAAPTFARVDTDPSQVHAWQKESSVRHVTGPGNQNSMYGMSGSSHTALPQHFHDFSSQTDSPGRPRAGSDSSTGGHGTPSRISQYRNSGWGRPPATASPSPVGVTGAD
ncbi:RhoGAP-domain-containing protein [Xylona heveae TC161]|uniref:RhoGAP-domain-containing protein n=1 Tax=Xylona heveae (strain CBS 132557 / TC161) TaxID=1328760 RepID=A0A165HMM7_XYLHT|nr:RhoGAP-domain-containing protein [Xylona heveae TC161]KZF23742.1 RhoGAP-domain-containing protein [Xylona heveae TC161]